MRIRFLSKASFLPLLISLFLVACPGCYSISGPNTYLRKGVDRSKIKKVAVFSFHNNTEVADATLSVYQRRSLFSPFRRLCRLTCRSSAHFEYVTRSPDGLIESIHRPIG